MNLNWNKNESSENLIPAIVQDISTRQVLMLGYMNPESLELTRTTGKVTFYSRTRKSIWQKGETSGNTLEVAEIQPDCDQDALLILAKPIGPTCHTGETSCFKKGLSFLAELEKTIKERVKFSKRRELQDQTRPSYVLELLKQGEDRIIQKVGEEAIETVIAAKGSDPEKLESEAADLIFHLMVLLNFRGSSLAAISETLEKRRK